MNDPIVYQSTSARFGLPFLFAAQSQREFFVNEALSRIDLLMHASINGESSVPPATPSEGDAWLVGPDPQGAWAGYEGQLAGFGGGGWIFVAPRAGLRVWDAEAEQVVLFDGGQWARPAAPSPPAGGAVVDDEARAAIVNLIASLRVAGIFSGD